VRHRRRSKKLGRQPAHRKATVISLVESLIKYKRIETTLTKAKEARRLAEKVITLGKKDTLHARRHVYSFFKDRDIVGIVFKDLAPLFSKRPGGYTRVMRMRIRPGDGAQMAILEWIEKKEVKPEAKPEPKKEPEKPKVEQKPPEAPKQTGSHKQKKGFLGGLRKIFGDKKGK